MKSHTKITKRQLKMREQSEFRVQKKCENETLIFDKINFKSLRRNIETHTTSHLHRNKLNGGTNHMMKMGMEMGIALIERQSCLDMVNICIDLNSEMYCLIMQTC